jgi:outer membrane immunogenic protein
MKFKLLISAMSLMLCSSVFAQSAFQGFYGQVSSGYEVNRINSVRLTGQDNGGLPNISNSASPSAHSAPLVFGLGYTFLVKDKFTLGLGIDYSPLTQTTNAAGFYYPGFSVEDVYNYNFSVSNRLSVFLSPGFAIDTDRLAYVKLGYSTEQVKYAQTNCCSTPSNKANVNGYVLGLGYKQMIKHGLYAFAEANYYAYDKANLSSSYSDGPGGTVSANPKSTAYNFLLGIGYRF